MKRSIIALLLLAALLLTGCAAKTAEEPEENQPQQTETAPEPAEKAEEPKPEAAEAPETEAAPEATEEPEPEEAQQAEPEPEEPQQQEQTPLDVALSLVDHELSELTALLGEPLESRYEASCAGDGDDGVLEFDGVTVFTYREKDGSAETVIDAE